MDDEQVLDFLTADEVKALNELANTSANAAKNGMALARSLASIRKEVADVADWLDGADSPARPSARSNGISHTDAANLVIEIAERLPLPETYPWRKNHG